MGKGKAVEKLFKITGDTIIINMEHFKKFKRRRHKKLLLAMNVLLFLLLFLSLSFPCTVGEHRQEVISEVIGWSKAKNSIVIECKNALVNLTILQPNVVHVKLAPQKTVVPDRSWAVLPIIPEDVEYQLNEGEDFIHITTSELVIKINKRPFILSFYDVNGNLINRDYEPLKWKKVNEGYWVESSKYMPLDEHYYGFGEKTGSLDKRRSSITMWNTDAYGYDSETDPLYKSIPFFIGLNRGNAYGIFLDNSYRTNFDMGHTYEDRYIMESTGGEFEYYFFGGPSVKEVVEDYTSLTGRINLPPMWSLGHQLCRYSYYPQERVLEIAKRCREEGIPCDTIYLDIHYHEGYKPFTWSEERFPDPETLLESLEEMGFKVICIVDPAIKIEEGYQPWIEGKEGDYFLKYKKYKWGPFSRLYKDEMWPGLCVWPDFTRDDVQEWWGNLTAELIEQGVDGIWNDMNEPAVFNELKTMPDKVMFYDHGLKTSHLKNHNIYALAMVKSTYEGLIEHNPTSRPFVLTRAGYSGIQRYAATWTGDNTANWDHLILQIPMFLNLGMSGVPFVGSDIGGFIGSPSAELLARWYEASAFVPLFRDHTAIGTADQEPWTFGDYHQKIITKYIKLRYEHIPYLYNLLYESSQKGYPILRPLFFEFQSDENTYRLQDEFMVGGSMLIAPILGEHQQSRLVYLPEGTWWDYWNHREIEGGSWINYEALLDTLPIFLRGGSVIPKQEAVQWIGERELDRYTFEFFVPEHTEFEYTFYEDDGLSTNSAFGMRKISGENNGKKLTLLVSEREGNFPLREYIEFKIYGISPGLFPRFSRAQVNGEPVRLDKNTADGSVSFKVKNTSDDMHIEINI